MKKALNSLLLIFLNAILTFFMCLPFGFLGLKTIIVAIVLVTVSGLIFKLPSISASLTSSLVGIWGLTAAFQWVPGLATLPYHRPHEMFATDGKEIGFPVYEKNINFTFKNAFGEFNKKGSAKPGLVKQQRNIEFITDSIGFRNRKDYSNESLIVVGDSFATGSSNTQTDILSEQITHLGIPAYSASFPGALSHYVQYIRYVRSNLSKDAHIAVIIFEGNDFGLPEVDAGIDMDSLSVTVKDPLRDKYFPFLKKSHLYRLTWGISKALSSKQDHSLNQYLPYRDISLYKVGDSQMGFLQTYERMSAQKSTASFETTRSQIAILASIADSIYFVPTASRVYKEFIPGLEFPEPAPTWELLRDVAGKVAHAKCFNATEKLRERSRNILSQNKYTYWLDDSHWNREGISVVAETIVQLLKNPEQALNECPPDESVTDTNSISAPSFDQGGPLTTEAGVSFNTQADGSAALWAMGENITHTTVFVWDDMPLLSIATPPSSITASVPKDLYATPGTSKLKLKDLLTGKESIAKDFIVSPAVINSYNNPNSTK